jgi:hypothetical protein
MYLLAALIFALLGAYLSPGDISDTPFSQLTLKMLSSSLVTWGCYFGALYYAFKSMGTDRIWPWRWTLPYFGNLCIRAAMSALYIWVAAYLIEKKNLDGWSFILVAGLLVMMLIYTCFSSEFDHFKEKGSFVESPHGDENV